jgi:hypothetical protein
MTGYVIPDNRYRSAKPMKLTHRILENLTCPEGQKDRLVADDDQTGLYIRIGAKACKGSLTHKNFLAKAGRTRIPLGRCTAISLAQAREAARSIMGDIAKGLNPLAGREVATAARKAPPSLPSASLSAIGRRCSSSTAG